MLKDMGPATRQRFQTNSPNVKKDMSKKNSKKTAGNIRKGEMYTNPSYIDIGVMYPSGDTAFKALLSARFCAAIWSHISDCDETYNYWEPSHYLMFGQGFQTWEYSPEYALRSYTYLMVHVVPAWIYYCILQPNKMLVFYFCRCLLGLFCTLCEVYFYKSICREFGINVARLMLLIMLFSPGMFISSTAYLPSSFSMYMTLLSMGAWFQRKYELAVFTTALSAFLSWPFAALIGVPPSLRLNLVLDSSIKNTAMYTAIPHLLPPDSFYPQAPTHVLFLKFWIPICIDMLWFRSDWIKFIQSCVISCFAILLPMTRIDSLYYGRLVVAPLNIIKYNVFSSHGPNLYGTEPWHFYFINGFLNFNFIFVAALFTPLSLILVKVFISKDKNYRSPQCIPYWLSLQPLYLWLCVFCLQPHKEERFLFPVYPLICLCGAVTVDCIQKLWFRAMVRTGVHYLHHTMHVITPVMAACCLLGLSRTFALYKGYHAPMDTFMELNKLTVEGDISTEQNINICIGKEWYRYPSSFFLPSENWQLQFLQSEFRGQLPQQYSILDNGSMTLPPNMNDENREEPSRYVDVSICHYLVDVDTGVETPREPNYSQQTDQWSIIKSIPFLDAPRSNRILRAFYVPLIWEQNCYFHMYNLLKAKKTSKHNSSKHR